MITRFYNGYIFRQQNFVEGEVWISDNKIISPQNHANKEVDLKGKLLAPGFIDLQINGGFGIDFSHEPERIDEVCALLPHYGVTSFLPTIISNTPQNYRRIVPLLNSQKHQFGANILGLHLEGPFLNPSFAGAHAHKNFIHDCHGGLEKALECYGTLHDVKMVTLAPELPGAYDLIKALSKQKIVVAAGHSAATYECIEKAREMGLSCITHLFNAMSPFHHRAPGIIGAALSSPKKERLSYSLIVDGAHLHPAAIELAWSANARGCFLVSDACSAMKTPLDKEITKHCLAMQKLDVNDTSCFLSGTKTLAGSTIPLDEAVRNFHRVTKCSRGDAIATVTCKPAALIGIDKIKGTLIEGADADIVILDNNLFVINCYVGGKFFPGGNC